MDNCWLCGHLHDLRDMLLDAENVCQWCADLKDCPLTPKPAPAQPHD